MSTFIKFITNKWVQLGSFIVNVLFVWNAVYQYSSLVETEKHYMLKKQILMFCTVVFGLLVIAHVVTFLLNRNQDKEALFEYLDQREKQKQAKKSRKE